VRKNPVKVNSKSVSFEFARGEIGDTFAELGTESSVGEIDVLLDIASQSVVEAKMHVLVSRDGR
jgi:hypothetical protein